MYGLFIAPHALAVQSPALPQIDGTEALLPLKLEGTGGINSLFEYRLVLKTTDGLSFTGRRGSFVAGALGGLTGLGSVAHQGTGLREISALITSAYFIGGDNSALTRANSYLRFNSGKRAAAMLWRPAQMQITGNSKWVVMSTAL